MVLVAGLSVIAPDMKAQDNQRASSRQERISMRPPQRHRREFGLKFHNSAE